MGKNRIAVILTFIFVSLVVGSCRTEGLTSVEPTLTPKMMEKSQSSYVVFRNYKELSEASDVVLIGRPVKELEVINTARDPSDSSRPAPHDFVVGQVYEISVDDYLKGSGPKTVYVIQYQGDITSMQSGQTLTPEEISAAKQEWGGYALKIGQRYLLFLFRFKYDYGAYPMDITFGIQIHPGRFLLTDKDCVVLEDEAGLEAYYPPVFLQTVREQLDRGGEDATVGAYPPPEGDGCAEPSGDSLPYP